MSEETSQVIKSSNKYANDGSFLEMFRKQMREKQQGSSTMQDTETENSTDDKKSTEESGDGVSPKSDSTESSTKKYNFPLVGKRRGANRSLKTGIVAKKPKQSSDDKESKDKTPGDAWSKYLQEVNAYKTKLCIEEDKSRPLVK